MEAFLSLWWVFPAAVVFATVAVGSGVSGALFFSPFFMLVVGLSPAQAVGAGLLTETFGMGNGLRSYVRQGVVDFATARSLLSGAVPGVVAGALVAHRIPEAALRTVFGLGLLCAGGGARLEGGGLEHPGCARRQQRGQPGRQVAAGRDDGETPGSRVRSGGIARPRAAVLALMACSTELPHDRRREGHGRESGEAPGARVTARCCLQHGLRGRWTLVPHHEGDGHVARTAR